MKSLQEFQFNNIYQLADLIDKSVKAKIEIWNYNLDLFVKTATKFSRYTMLHLYIVTTALNYYHRDFLKNEDMYDEENLEEWYSLFDNYNIEIDKFKFTEDSEIVEWFDRNSDKFEELFFCMADV